MRRHINPPAAELSVNQLKLTAVQQFSSGAAPEAARALRAGVGSLSFHEK